MSSETGAILITGAAMGIGRAVAEAYATLNRQMVLLDTNAEALGSFPASPNTLAITGSVTSPADCARAVAAGIERFGAISAVSHNAGVQRYGDVLTTTDAAWAEVIDINLTGAFNIAKAAMPQLRAHRGAICFTASVQGMAAQKGALGYVVSKHGLIGLVTAMAMDEAEHGVRILGVAPGSVDTPMLQAAIDSDPNPKKLSAEIDAMHPIGRRARPSEIASVIAFLLSDANSFMTGETVRVDGGLLARIPGAPTNET